MSARNFFDTNFFDTNIFVYTDANDEPVKQARALELIEQGKRARSAALSTQVLNEYFAASTRKLGGPVEIARRKVELFAQLDVVVLQVEDTLHAIDLGSRYRSCPSGMPSSFRLPSGGSARCFTAKTCSRDCTSVRSPS